MLKVTHYQAGFRLGDNTYFIQVKDENDHLSTIPVSSVEAFIAMLTILGRQDVVFNTANHALELPLRPVGT